MFLLFFGLLVFSCFSLLLLLASLSELGVEGEAGDQATVLLLMHVMEHRVILMLLLLEQLLVLVLELLLLSFPRLVLSVSGEIGLSVYKVVIMVTTAMTTDLFFVQLELALGSLLLQLLLVPHQAVLVVGWRSWARRRSGLRLLVLRLYCRSRLPWLQTQRLLLLGRGSPLAGSAVGRHNLAETLGQLFLLEGSLALFFQVSLLVLQVPNVRL